MFAAMRIRRGASGPRFCAVLLTGASLVAAKPALGGGTARRADDRRATTTYLRAYVAQTQAGQRAVKLGAAGLRLFVVDTRRECGGVLTDMPSASASRGHVEEAIVGVLTIKLTGFAARENLRFSQAIRQLRWTSPALTRVVSTFAAVVAEGAHATSVELPLCSTLRTWAESGFTTLPNALSQFSGQLDERAAHEKRLRPLDEQERTILSQLRTYETPEQQSAARRAQGQTDASAADAVGALARAKRELFRALGVSP